MFKSEERKKIMNINTCRDIVTFLPSDGVSEL